VDKVDTNEAEGFFPERMILRARRLKAMPAKAVDASAARTRSTEMWVPWITIYLPAIFLPMFFSAITSWNGHITPRAAKVVILALWLMLAACAALVGIGVWRNLRRANTTAGA
jgi:hypothetical protein